MSHPNQEYTHHVAWHEKHSFFADECEYCDVKSEHGIYWGSNFIRHEELKQLSKQYDESNRQDSDRVDSHENPEADAKENQ